MRILDKLAEEEPDIHQNLDLFKRLLAIKHKDILRETLAEY